MFICVAWLWWEIKEEIWSSNSSISDNNNNKNNENNENIGNNNINRHIQHTEHGTDEAADITLRECG